MIVTKVSQNDISIPITIKLAFDCVGELILAEVYSSSGVLVGNVNAILPTILDPTPAGLVLGGLKGTFVTVKCNFALIAAGDQYTLVFRTTFTGAVTTNILIVFNKSGIYLPDDVCSSPGSATTSSSSTTTPAVGGSAKTKQLTIVWQTAMGYSFPIADLDTVHEFKIFGISYPEALNYYEVDTQTIVIDPTKLTLEVNDVLTFDYYPTITEE